MSLNSQSGEVRRERRMCCCTVQTHIGQAEVDHLAREERIQLRNLPEAYREELEGKSPFAIRQFFHDSSIPFRYEGCPRANMICCGSCSRNCLKRCPQDVMNRAYLFCGSILDASTEDIRAERYRAASTPVKMLYDELVSEPPRYFAIAAMITEMTSPVYNKELERIIKEEYGNEDTPHRLDYAPQVEYEEYFQERPDGYKEARLRKKVDPVTGEVMVHHWPRSGMCPYCLPVGLVDRRRTTGPKSRR